MEFDYHEAMKLANQLCFPLYAASRNVIGLYTPWLKPLGLTYTQYIVFLVLWEKDGITVGEICDKLMLDNGTVSPLLKKMQQAGYVERKRSEDDNRVVVITLTEEGKARPSVSITRTILPSYWYRFILLLIYALHLPAVLFHIAERFRRLLRP